MTTQADVKELSHEVAKYYALGLNTLQISKKLAVTYSQVLTARNHIAEEVKKEAGSLWVTFQLQYQRTIAEAVLALQTAKSERNLNARVGAIRTLLDATEKAAGYAQKLGLVHQVPEEVVISLKEQAQRFEDLFGFNVNDMQNLVTSN